MSNHPQNPQRNADMNNHQHPPQGIPDLSVQQNPPIIPEMNIQQNPTGQVNLPHGPIFNNEILQSHHNPARPVMNDNPTQHHPGDVNYSYAQAPSQPHIQHGDNRGNMQVHPPPMPVAYNQMAQPSQQHGQVNRPNVQVYHPAQHHGQAVYNPMAQPNQHQGYLDRRNMQPYPPALPPGQVTYNQMWQSNQQYGHVNRRNVQFYHPAQGPMQAAYNPMGQPNHPQWQDNRGNMPTQPPGQAAYNPIPQPNQQHGQVDRRNTQLHPPAQPPGHVAWNQMWQSNQQHGHVDRHNVQVHPPAQPHGQAAYYPMPQPNQQQGQVHRHNLYHPAQPPIQAAYNPVGQQNHPPWQDHRRGYRAVHHPGPVANIPIGQRNIPQQVHDQGYVQAYHQPNHHQLVNNRGYRALHPPRRVVYPEIPQLHPPRPVAYPEIPQLHPPQLADNRICRPVYTGPIAYNQIRHPFHPQRPDNRAYRQDHPPRPVVRHVHPPRPVVPQVHSPRPVVPQGHSPRPVVENQIGQLGTLSPAPPQQPVNNAPPPAFDNAIRPDNVVYGQPLPQIPVINVEPVSPNNANLQQRALELPRNDDIPKPTNEAICASICGYQYIDTNISSITQRERMRDIIEENRGSAQPQHCACKDDSGRKCHTNDCKNRRNQMACPSDCGPNCCNNPWAQQHFTFAAGVKTYIKHNQEKQFGMYAHAPIQEGEFIGEYNGILMAAGTILPEEEHHYLLKLADSNLIINPYRSGNCLRLVSHSCNPNCEARIYVHNEVYKIVFVAIRDIKKDSELTFHYESFEESRIKCYCSSTDDNQNTEPNIKTKQVWRPFSAIRSDDQCNKINNLSERPVTVPENKSESLKANAQEAGATPKDLNNQPDETIHNLLAEIQRFGCQNNATLKRLRENTDAWLLDEFNKENKLPGFDKKKRLCQDLLMFIGDRFAWNYVNLKSADAMAQAALDHIQNYNNPLEDLDPTLSLLLNNALCILNLSSLHEQIIREYLQHQQQRLTSNTAQISPASEKSTSSTRSGQSQYTTRITKKRTRQKVRQEIADAPQHLHVENISPTQPSSKRQKTISIIETTQHASSSSPPASPTKSNTTQNQQNLSSQQISPEKLMEQTQHSNLALTSQAPSSLSASPTKQFTHTQQMSPDNPIEQTQYSVHDIITEMENLVVSSNKTQRPSSVPLETLVVSPNKTHRASSVPVETLVVSPNKTLRESSVPDNRIKLGILFGNIKNERIYDTLLAFILHGNPEKFDMKLFGIQSPPPLSPNNVQSTKYKLMYQINNLYAEIPSNINLNRSQHRMKKVANKIEYIFSSNDSIESFGLVAAFEKFKLKHPSLDIMLLLLSKDEVSKWNAFLEQKPARLLILSMAVYNAGPPINPCIEYILSDHHTIPTNNVAIYNHTKTLYIPMTHISVNLINRYPCLRFRMKITTASEKNMFVLHSNWPLHQSWTLSEEQDEVWAQVLRCEKRQRRHDDNDDATKPNFYVNNFKFYLPDKILAMSPKQMNETFNDGTRAIVVTYREFYKLPSHKDACILACFSDVPRLGPGTQTDVWKSVLEKSPHVHLWLSLTNSKALRDRVVLDLSTFSNRANRKHVIDKSRIHVCDPPESELETILRYSVCTVGTDVYEAQDARQVALMLASRLPCVILKSDSRASKECCGVLASINLHAQLVALDRNDYYSKLKQLVKSPTRYRGNKFDPHLTLCVNDLPPFNCALQVASIEAAIAQLFPRVHLDEWIALHPNLSIEYNEILATYPALILDDKFVTIRRQRRTRQDRLSAENRMEVQPNDDVVQDDLAMDNDIYESENATIQPSPTEVFPSIRTIAAELRENARVQNIQVEYVIEDYVANLEPGRLMHFYNAEIPNANLNLVAIEQLRQALPKGYRDRLKEQLTDYLSGEQRNQNDQPVAQDNGDAAAAGNDNAEISPRGGAAVDVPHENHPDINMQLLGWNDRFVMPIWSIQQYHELMNLSQTEHEKWLMQRKGQRIVNIASLMSAVDMIFDNMLQNLDRLPAGICMVYYMVLKLQEFFQCGFPLYNPNGHVDFFKFHKFFDTHESMLFTHYHTITHRDLNGNAIGHPCIHDQCGLSKTDFERIDYRNHTTKDLRKLKVVEVVIVQDPVHPETISTPTLKETFPGCVFCGYQFRKLGGSRTADAYAHQHRQTIDKHRYHSHTYNCETASHTITRCERCARAFPPETEGEDGGQGGNVGPETLTRHHDLAGTNNPAAFQELSDHLQRSDPHVSPVHGEILSVEETTEDYLRDLRDHWQDFLQINRLDTPMASIAAYGLENNHWKKYQPGQRAWTFMYIKDHVYDVVNRFGTEDIIPQVSSTGLFGLQFLDTLQAAMSRNPLTYVPQLPKQPMITMKCNKELRIRAFLSSFVRDGIPYQFNEQRFKTMENNSNNYRTRGTICPVCNVLHPDYDIARMHVFKDDEMKRPNQVDIENAAIWTETPTDGPPVTIRSVVDKESS